MKNLVEVFLRFRREYVAVMADIEKMFYCFFVYSDHRQFLRFIRHEDNNFQKPLVDYQMKVHVFDNSPSPAVATADKAEAKYGSDMKNFVRRNFYVNDTLPFHPTTEDADNLLSRTKDDLQEYGRLRLHKISSNFSIILESLKKITLQRITKMWIYGLVVCKRR